MADKAGPFAFLRPQALLEKVDETWDEMLKARACTDVAFEEGELVTAESWVAHAAALALCARGSGTGAEEVMSRQGRFPVDPLCVIGYKSAAGS